MQMHARVIRSLGMAWVGLKNHQKFGNCSHQISPILFKR